MLNTTNYGKDGLDNRQKYADAMCFPYLFSSETIGQFRQVKLTTSNYAKTPFLNTDSHFRQEAAHPFFFLW